MGAASSATQQRGERAVLPILVSAFINDTAQTTLLDLTASSALNRSPRTPLRHHETALSPLQNPARPTKPPSFQNSHHFELGPPRHEMGNGLLLVGNDHFAFLSHGL